MTMIYDDVRARATSTPSNGTPDLTSIKKASLKSQTGFQPISFFFVHRATFVSFGGGLIATG